MARAGMLLAAVLALRGVAVADEAGQCVQAHVELPFQQHVAPTANELWGIATTELDKLSIHAKNFGITYKGGIQQALVGEHVIYVNLTHAGKTYTGPPCAEISFDIIDSDECALSSNETLAAMYPAWTHVCHHSSLCVNTIGSYDCACPADSGTFGALFSGSVKAADGPDYELSPGICHGFGSTAGCCGQPDLLNHQNKFERQIVCNTPECIANCKADFVCENPCNALGRAESPRAKALASHVHKATGDDTLVQEFKNLTGFTKVLAAWRDELTCVPDTKSAGFEIQCREDWAPEEEYEGNKPFPYHWWNRTDPLQYTAYHLPKLENVELRCFDLSRRLYCDPRQAMQCPCHCHCVDAPEYRRVTGESVPLGRAYYCLPDDGFMAVEPADFTELTDVMSDWTDGLPPNHVSNPHQVSPRFNKRNDTHICVDKTPPAINLLHKDEVFYQGDPTYQPPTAVFDDRNVDAQLRRTMQVTMSPELWGEGGHLVEVGDFAVRFMAETPWLTEDAREVSVEHPVKVLDVDECTYDGPVEQFRHKCFRREGGDPRYADGVCVNIKMIDNNGPGYTCACPDGYEGNAFADEAAFLIHQQGKEQLVNMHTDLGAGAAISGEQARDLGAWLQATREFRGFDRNPQAGNASALYCWDVRAPDFGCGPDGCNTIELEAASAKALTIKHTGEPTELTRDMLLEQTPDLMCESKWQFVRTILEDQKAVERYCGENFERCLTATDVLVDGDKNYDQSIQLLGLHELFTEDSIFSHCSRTCAAPSAHEGSDEPSAGGDNATDKVEVAVNADATAAEVAVADDEDSWFCDTLLFRAEFSVTDLAGNTANTSLNLAVKPMNMTKVLGAPPVTAQNLAGRSAFVKRFVPKWIIELVLLVFGAVLFVVLYSNMNNLLAIAHLLQLLLVPFTLTEDRDSFESAIRTVFWVQSGGSYYGWTSHQLDTKVEEEWQNFQMGRSK